jgi:three-Cys-motif partner protein
MDEHYIGREQTAAKHLILKGYLGAFAAKLINYYNLAYVDAFSGPWQSASDAHEDTSFKIALDTLLAARRVSNVGERKPKNIRCFFSEKKPSSHAELARFLEGYKGIDQFEVRDFKGSFEDAIPEIQAYIKGYFPLFFIDPTGWTGVNLASIKPLIEIERSEVLINFMFEFINRAVNMEDEKTVASFNGFLGSDDWQAELDPTLPRGIAALNLFKDRLKATGNFKYVASTNIEMSAKDRTHFFIVYGTKDYAGLELFREQEFKTKLEHGVNRLSAKRRNAAKLKEPTFFEELEDHSMIRTQDELRVKNEIDIEIKQTISEAMERTKQLLSSSIKIEFTVLSGKILELFSLKETHVKDICKALAKMGLIEDTWSIVNKRKPDKGIVLRWDPQ